MTPHYRRQYSAARLKLILFSTTLLCIITYSSASDTIVNFPKEKLNLYEHRTHYFCTYRSYERADSAAKVNSAELRKKDQFRYYLNELSRVQILSLGDQIPAALTLVEQLKNVKYIQESNVLTAYLNNVTGGIFFSLNKPQTAQVYYAEAARIFALTTDSVGLKGSLINTGNTCAAQRQEEKAIEFYNKAQELEDLGIMPFKYALMNNKANLYKYSNEREKAIPVYEKVLSQSEHPLGPDQFAVTALNLGECYFSIKEYDKAIAILDSGRQVAWKDHYHDVLQNTLRTLSFCYYNTGQTEKAYKTLYVCDSLEVFSQEKQTEEFIQQLTQQHQNELFTQQEAMNQERLVREEKEQFRLKLFSLALVLFLALTIYLYYKKREKNKILLEKNLELSRAIAATKKKKKEVEKSLSNELKEKLLSSFYEQELFKDPEISLEKLAKKIGTNRSYLSEQINSNFKMPFRSLINKLRIEEARQLLIDPKFAHYSIEGIATSVGYRNISSFNSAFKRETGLTPSYFRKNYRKPHSQRD